MVNILVLVLYLSGISLSLVAKQTQIRISARTRKKKYSDSCALCLRQGRFHGEIKIIVFAFVPACVASKNQA